MPAFNEEKLIEKSISQVPTFVDYIIVVDDCSTDQTNQMILSLKETNDKIVLIKNRVNKGVGYSIKKGYSESLRLDSDISVVMAGDAQMDPAYLPELLAPLVDGEADYTKGDRLSSNMVNDMPGFRRFGNSILSILNKLSTGYWEIEDPQNGYTAINKSSLGKILQEKITDGYGNPNDFLLALSIHDCKVKDVVIPPVYGEEVSGIKTGRFIIFTTWILISGFFRRINKKYGGSRLHPVWFFYYFGFFSFISGVFLSIFVLYHRFFVNNASSNTVILTFLLLIFGFQSLLAGMFMDMRN